MAVVQLATDVHLRRTVAVKRLRPELASKEEIRERFFGEAEILAGLEHPGTTPIFESGLLPDGDYFYAMKRVSGRTLRELLAERTPEDILDRADRTHFIEIFIRACQTVAAAHDSGVIHRDLKPENIMVDELGVVYVMDWGLAKRLSEEENPDLSDSARTQVGDVMGSPAYMSPEQASGHSATSDRQTDVFSLGVMLYEILTGINPFRGKTAVESMKGVMYHKPDTPRSRNPPIDRTISAITMKALDKDPFRRYQSARELAEDVRCYREFLPVSAIKPRRIDRFINWSRRWPRLTTFAATLAVVVFVGGLSAGFQASVEQARVSGALDIIDQIESRQEEIKTETSALLDRKRSSTNLFEHRRIEHRLAAIEAEYEAAEKERLSISLAVTGFTILAPDRQASKIVRDSTLDTIREHMLIGDFYRAQAEIHVAVRHYEGGNAFGYSKEEQKLLQAYLTTVQTAIEENEFAEKDVTASSPR